MSKEEVFVYKNKASYNNGLLFVVTDDKEKADLIVSRDYLDRNIEFIGNMDDLKEEIMDVSGRYNVLDTTGVYHW